jgi:hypothetical protein
VALDNVFDDREAESGASRLPATRGIDTVKPLRHARQMFSRNAWSVIGDRRDDPTIVAPRRYLDRRIRLVAAVSERVADEIVEELDELRTVAIGM